MSRPHKPPVFLHRDTYRQRRLRDAARLVPFLGLMLWLIPLAWPSDTQQGQIGAAGLVYIFGAWLLLILLTAIFASRIRSDSGTDGAGDTER